MTTLRSQIESIYRHAVESVDPRASVRNAIADELAEGRLFGVNLTDPVERSVYLIAIGKAAAQMTLGAADTLGDVILSGIVITKEPATERVSRMVYLESAHPVPDERSIAAGEAVLDFAADLPGNALVLCLISGGASSLVESLRPGISIEMLRSTTTRLLKSGAPIEDLNAVRSRMSRIKGGGLLRALGVCPVVNLIVSDVLGDDVRAIASGPTVIPDDSISAAEVAAAYGVDVALPSPPTAPGRPPRFTIVVANLHRAIDAAAARAEELGLRPVLLTDRLEGEAREAGRTMARILRSSEHPLSPLGPGVCVLAGGETTVNVRGKGTGGRNTECALAAAIDLYGTSGVTVGFLATDGDDGITGAAGAIVDGATISASNMGRARRALADNDSFGYLSEVCAAWSPGATGTNVNDLMIAIIE